MGATVSPLIIATDKTQLMQFSGGKQAYPVYITLGNIPRELRCKPSEQACVLLAYFPVNKIDKEGLATRELSGRHARLFHDCMRHLLHPLEAAGKEGVDMTSADGCTRHVYPILASYVADFPEQCLVACSKYGTCPKCRIPATELHASSAGLPRTQDWTLSVMRDAQRDTDQELHYFKACMRQEVSGYVYRPFWDGLPYTNIHLSITPDVLHQLYQGVLKHVISWVEKVLTPAELDRRIKCLPPSLGVRRFEKGISILSQVSGSERKHIRILLGCLLGSDITDKGITACRGLMDFIYLSQYPSHDDDTLLEMEEALRTWHQHARYFTDIGAHLTLDIPKIHSMLHYADSITYFGCTDNYNTEMFERLHIDFAKKAWRASNKREELAQMTTWISRQEQVKLHAQSLALATDVLRLRYRPSRSVPVPAASPHPSQNILLPKHPSMPKRTTEWVEKTYKLPDFREHLLLYLSLLQDHVPETEYTIPFNTINLYNSVKLSLESLDVIEDTVENTVKASPTGSGRYDTVVVLTGDDAENSGLHGLLFCCP